MYISDKTSISTCLNKTTGWNHYRITQDYRNMEFTSNTICEKYKETGHFQSFFILFFRPPDPKSEKKFP